MVTEVGGRVKFLDSLHVLRFLKSQFFLCPVAMLVTKIEVIFHQFLSPVA